jgi:hypothetical protein
MHLRLLLLAFLLAPLGMAGCAALEQTAALRQVRFAIDDVSQARLAGVNLDQATRYEDLGPVAIGRIGAAVAIGQLPLQFTMHVGAENPAENPTAARLSRMEWILLLDNVETISGLVDDAGIIQPGQRAQIPIRMELDLLEFFDRNIRNLVDLGLAVSGQGQQDVALRLRPTINTAFGPISYPGYITIRHTVGG